MLVNYCLLTILMTIAKEARESIHSLFHRFSTERVSAELLPIKIPSFSSANFLLFL